MVNDESSQIHKPNPRELPIAKEDIASILISCYEEQLPVAEAVEKCRNFGAKDFGTEQVEDAYGELRRLAEKLNKTFEAYLEQKTNAGGNEPA